MNKNQRNILLVVVVLIVVAAILLIQNPFKKSKSESVIVKEEAVTDVKSALGTAIGDKAPNVILNDLESKPVLLSDYKGKKNVIVNFWATWCPPCKEEMPLFQKLYEQNKEQLVVLGVNLQEDAATIKNFLEEYGITFPILLDPDAEIKKLYNVITQPVTYFINKDGIIVDKKQGPLTPEEINEKVDKLLKSKPIELQKEEIKTLPDGTKYIVHPNKLLPGGPPKDGIPSIDRPKFISVEEANKFVSDDELVLGINLNGDKRAYPFQILVWHEIVNDVVASKPVVITYCPLCGTGIAYERTINGEAVEFGVSGLLHNSDLVMYDRKTDTLWGQINGKAIVGELTGMRLKQVPIDTVTWSDWKKSNPDTKVLSRETGFIRSYGRAPYGDYDTSRSIYFPVENEDLRLHPKEVIFGVEINGKFKAYTEEDLKKFGKIEDKFNGLNLIIERSDAGIVTVKNKDTNEDIVPVRSFWFAWFAFHPDTELHKG